VTLVVRVGGWLFRQRTWLPLPFAVALLFIPTPNSASAAPFWIVGFAFVLAGESLRLWSVHHIGAISRTRSTRLGPLVVTGPFGFVRNPLYLGNIALWIGFTVTARLLWLAPSVIVLLALEYHAIVRWEEELLTLRLGESYRRYVARVPRWLPGLAGTAAARSPSSASSTSSTPGGDATFSCRETLFSERGTLIAIAVGYALLLAKLQT
jgi:protein-S-isoprenylcysteine O-methyltransferase Ste14